MSINQQYFRHDGGIYVRFDYFNQLLCAALGESEKIQEIHTYVTRQQLYDFGWKNVTDADVYELNRVLKKYDITTDLRIAFFLGETRHESTNFSRTLEKADAAANEAAFAEYFEDMYGAGTSLGRKLGNTQPGDGQLFRGAGYIQLTGRDNYQRFANAMNDPRIMTEGNKIVGGTYNRPISEINAADYGVIDVGKYAWEAAGYFWAHSVRGNLNDAADARDATLAKNGINPGEKDNSDAAKNRRKNIIEMYGMLTGQTITLS